VPRTTTTLQTRSELLMTNQIVPENQIPFRVKLTTRRLMVVIIVVAVLLLPALLRYRPPLVGAAGYNTFLVTDPGYWGSPVKAAQSFLEMQPCTYKLHGWDENNRLLYTAVCDETETIWRYDPARDRQQSNTTIPADLHTQRANRELVLTVVRADGVRPVRHEPYTRRLLLDEAGPVSADGRYTALITQHIYSVYDVVVLEAAE
jgi:hypothetical protein